MLTFLHRSFVMLKIWAKVMNSDKISTQLVYESIDNFTSDTFYLHVAEICHKLDLPSPIVLPMHIKHFTRYKNTTFKARDFVESISFDKLVLEDISQ